MPTSTLSELVEYLHLDSFEDIVDNPQQPARVKNRWVYAQAGAIAQHDRRQALLQARNNLAAMPEGNFEWLHGHLMTIQTDLSNSQPSEIRLRLLLTAYAIIHFLIFKQGNDAIRRIAAINNVEFNRFCHTEAVP